LKPFCKVFDGSPLQLFGSVLSWWPINLAGIIACENSQRNYSKHMPELLKIVAIGNSKGVRIPSAILRRQGIVNEVECIETLDGVLLRPIKSQELSFEDAFAQMAKDQEALDEVHEFEGTLGDGLEHDHYSN
jgi:antitoxin MazE